MAEVSIFMLKNEDSSRIESFINENYLEYVSSTLYNDPEDIDECNLAVFPLKDFWRTEQGISGKVFVLQEKQKPISWVDDINLFSEPEINFTDSNIVYKPLIIIKISQHSIYAISYSYGYTLLNKDYIVSDFGLDISRKKMDFNSIKRIKNTNFSDKLYMSSFSSKNDININEILNSQATPLILEEVFGGMAISFFDVESNRKDLNIFLNGRDSIKIKGNFTIEKDIVSIIKELGKIYRGKSTNRSFSNYELMSVGSKKKKELDSRLETFLNESMEKFKKNSNEFNRNDLGKLSIELPLNKLKSNVEDIQFRVKGIGRSNEYFNYLGHNREEIFAKIFAFFLKKGMNDFVENFKRINLSVKDPDTSISFDVGNLYRSLYIEFNSNSDKYILYQGKWLHIDKNIWKKTRDMVNSIPVLNYGIDFDVFSDKDRDEKGDKSEGVYNQRISELKSNEGIVCLDEKNFTSKKIDEGFAYYDINHNSRIEPCDLIKVNKDSVIFSHIKRGNTSSGLTHLLAQVKASCTLINQSEDFINHINNEITRLSEEDPEVITSKNMKSPKIILGCIVSSDKINVKNSKVFPVLFCINLVALIKVLKLENFEVSLVKISDTTS